MLSKISLVFMEKPNFTEIAKKNNITNPDLIYAGEVIEVVPSRPISILKQYFTLIYNFKFVEAYNMLSSETQNMYSLEDFEKANNEMTFYDLSSLKVVNDFIITGKRTLCINAQIEEDPASWAFTLVWESNNWRVVLDNLRPTFPMSKCVN